MEELLNNNKNVETKYYAFFTPDKKNPIMEDYLKQINKNTGNLISNSKKKHLDQNINFFGNMESYYKQNYNDEQFLILCKFTNVNSMFESKNIIQKTKKYDKLTNEVISCNEKYIVSYYNKTYCGIQDDLGYIYDTKTCEHIFQDYLIIDLGFLNSIKTNYFYTNDIEIELENIMINGSRKKVTDNTKNIFRLLHGIVSQNIKPKNGDIDRFTIERLFINNKNYLPIKENLDHYSNIIETLWNSIVPKIDNPNDVFNNKKLFCFESYKIDILPERKQRGQIQNQDNNNDNDEYKYEYVPYQYIPHVHDNEVKCIKRLYLTNKKFEDIEYFDALPFIYFFQTKDLKRGSESNTHNYKLKRINDMDIKLERLDETDTDNRYAINKLKKNREELLATMESLDHNWSKHILEKTYIMYNFRDIDYSIFGFYLSYVINNISFYNNFNYDNNGKLFLLNYEKEIDTNNSRHNKDIFNIYINNKFLKNIYKNSEKVDLYTLKNIGCESYNKFTELKSFITSKFNKDNIKFYNKFTIENNDKNISKLSKYIDDNINVKLFDYQKANTLFMLELEDQIDKNSVIYKTYDNNFIVDANRYNNYSSIKNYLQSLRFECSKLSSNFYILKNNYGKYYINFKPENIYETKKVEKFLNDFNNLTLIRRKTYTYDAEDEEREREYRKHVANPDKKESEFFKIYKQDDFFNKFSKNIEFNGGFICDEVGLGKTLSIISNIIVKHKHDIKKYNDYRRNMSEFLDKYKITASNFEDPLEKGFEYNNLIIVPNRLTSQWENEIEKYVKNKYKLKVKVLVSISSIKQLEKELKTHYQKCKKIIHTKSNTNSSNTNSSNINENNINTSNNEQSLVNTVTNDNIKSKKTVTIKKKLNVTPKEILSNTNNNEDNLSTPLTKKQIKEQKMIEKLMKKAKKMNDSINKKNNKVDNNLISPVLNQENKVTQLPSNVTLDDIFETNQPISSNTNNNTVKKNKESNNKESNNEESNNQTREEIFEQALKSLNDKYNFINKYLDVDVGDDNENYYLNEQLYDIYIVSVNLFTNDNYLNYLGITTDNNLEPLLTPDLKYSKIKEHIQSENKKISRYNEDKFDIFKIKWNRVILDEAHEKLFPPIKQGPHISQFKMVQEEQLCYEMLSNLYTNYKWGATGTPFECNNNSVAGSLEFLLKKNPDTTMIDKIQDIRYLNNICTLNENIVNSIISKLFKKTAKKDVKSLLNIPIFTEEIKFVDQTNIERNIYNSIRCSRYFPNERTRVNRLFLMCTNILINEGYDFNNSDDSNTSQEFENKMLTLEELNSNMINKFTKELKVLEREINTNNQAKEKLNEMNISFNKVLEFVESLGLDEILETYITNDIKNKIGNLEHNTTSKKICEMLIDFIVMIKCWENLDTMSTDLFDKCHEFKQKCFLWENKWNNHETILFISKLSVKYGIHSNNTSIAKIQKKIENCNNDIKRVNNQIALFSNNEFLKEKTNDPCIICFEDLDEVVVTPCRHIFCLTCCKTMANNTRQQFSCPECRTIIKWEQLNITTSDNINNNTITPETQTNSQLNSQPDSQQNNKNENLIASNPLDIKLGVEWKSKCINKYGSKMASLVEYLYGLFENEQNRVIIFSQYDKMLKMIGTTLNEFMIKYVYCTGNVYTVNKNINKFKKDNSIRVIMLSSETSNSGSNLTEANYIIFIDVLFNNPDSVKDIEAQAIGRAVRLGQQLPVKVVRFITKNTVEEEHYNKYKYDIASLQQ